MAFLLIAGSVVLSFLSTVVMSYLAISIEVTFWVAPIISLLMLLLSVFLLGKRLSQDSVVMLLAAGSLGEMIGLAIGFSWPTLYFLHKNIFLQWMESPVFFASMITMLVVAAGSLAAIITRLLWPRLKRLSFPTARVVYRMIYKFEKSDSNQMVKGMLLSGVWSASALAFRRSLQGFLLLQIHTIPTLLSMGFVAGSLVTKPLMLGMATRFFLLQEFQKTIFGYARQEDFVLTFALGMLSAVICKSFLILLKGLYAWMSVQNWPSDYIRIKNYTGKYFDWALSVGAIFFCSLILRHWHMSFAQQSYMIFALTVACMILASVFAETGVLDLPSFGSFVVIPFGYLFYVSSEVQLISFVFATICLGLVVVLLFSWKIADLARISLFEVVKYQAIGFFVAAISVGFVVWWYAIELNLSASSLFSSQALLQEKFMTLQLYDVRVWLFGFLFGVALYSLTTEMSLVITGCMMEFAVVGWVIFAGIIARFVKDREAYYPFCFGVYASHAIWLFVQTILL